MKKILSFLFFALPLTALAQTRIFALSNGVIGGVRMEYLDTKNSREVTEPYKLNGIQLSASVAGTSWTIRTGRYNGWENEPGQFDVIEFSNNGVRRLLYGTYGGVVKINDPENLYTYPLSKYSNNGYFIEVPLTPNSKAIMFLGQHYGTDLSRLSIFVVTPNNVKLVFNRQMAIREITNTARDFRMKLQTDIVDEYDSNGNPTGQKPPMSTIYRQNGVLYFE